MNARSRAWPAAGAATVFAVVLMALLPGRVIVRGDDFGYLESAVATIRSGHWMPSDWLAPFNLLLPELGAGVQAVTGNFWLATVGVLVVIAGVNYALLRAWLRPESMSGEMVVSAVALSPVWLNKAIEYTGVPLGLAFMLGALLAWRRGWRGLFFVLVAVACANRQSALCLLALPWVALQRGWRSKRQVDGGLVIGSAVIVIEVLTLMSVLPVTFGREVVTTLLRETSAMTVTGNVALAAVVLAALNAGWMALRGASLVAAWRENLARPVMPLALTLVGAWVILGHAAELRCETPGWEQAGALLVVVATFFGAWCGHWRSGPPAEAWACAAAYGALVALRGEWWDYYFLEPALVLAWPVVTPGAMTLRGRWPAWVLLAAGLIYAGLLGGYLHRTMMKIVAYEEGLRGGTLKISEASDAPFGYLGWKLLPTAVARGTKGAHLADFLKYVEGGRARWIDGALTVNRDGGRRSLHPSGEKWPLPPDYRDRDFPLTNAEWRDYLRKDARQ